MIARELPNVPVKYDAGYRLNRRDMREEFSSYQTKVRPGARHL